MIIGYVGLPGGGKTYLMTAHVRKKMKKLPVWANYPIVGARMWGVIEQIYNVRRGIIAMDEAGSVVNARKWQELPDEVIRQWQQSRKLSLDLYWTSQAFTSVDKVLRGITNYVWFCQQIFPGVHVAKLYPSEQCERVQNWSGVGTKPKALAWRIFFPALGYAGDAYDTLALVGISPSGQVDPWQLPILTMELLETAKRKYDELLDDGGRKGG